MEDPIIDNAKKEADELWKEKLEPDFNEHINKCLNETLKSLQGELQKFDEEMKKHIKSLDDNFSKNFLKQASQIKEQISVMENKSNIIQIKNPLYIKQDNK